MKEMIGKVAGRTLGSFLAAVFAFAFAAHADTETVDGIVWTYTVADGKATIEKYTGENYVPAVSPTPTGVLTIPATLGGYPVTTIGRRAFGDCDALTDVSIPASVTSIEDWAFLRCEAITSMVIPDSVTSKFMV